MKRKAETLCKAVLTLTLSFSSGCMAYSHGIHRFRPDLTTVPPRQAYDSGFYPLGAYTGRHKFGYPTRPYPYGFGFNGGSFIMNPSRGGFGRRR